MTDFPKLQAAAADIIRFAFPHIRAQAEAKGEKLAAFYFRFVAYFYAAASDGISQEDIDKQETTLLDAIWSGEAAEYDVPVQPSNPDGRDWLDRQSLLYRLGYELNGQAERICEETGDDSAYDTVRANFENAVIAAMQQCEREGVFGKRAENGLLLFAYYADADDDNKPEAEQLLHRSAKALNGKKGYGRIVAVGTEQ